MITDKNTYTGIMRLKEVATLSEKNFRILYDFPAMKSLAEELNVNDLLVVISARQNTVSYSRKLALMPRVITRFFGHTNSMILYPEQMDIIPDSLEDTFGIRT